MHQKKLKLLKLPSQASARDEVLIKPMYAGICGSDVSLFGAIGRHRHIHYCLDMKSVGRVIAFGNQLQNFSWSAGDR